MLACRARRFECGNLCPAFESPEDTAIVTPISDVRHAGLGFVGAAWDSAVTPSGDNATALPLTTDDDLQLRDGAGRLVAISASWEASTEQLIAVS